MYDSTVTVYNRAPGGIWLPTVLRGVDVAAGEAALMEGFPLPELEVLIVGHHGSKTSTSPDLLEATHPKVAVISVGADNSYGHPAPEILDRLSQFGCTVYRTDEDGTIIYRG